jgi:hypothetical protein
MLYPPQLLPCVRQSRWIRLSWAAALLFAVAAAYYSAAHAQEPTYNGRPLSQWLDDLQGYPSEARSKAEKAIRAIGSAAVPTLLTHLRTLPPPALEAPDAAAHENQSRAWRALSALRLIGQSACTRESVAALTELSVGPDRFQARQALETLAAWGPSASNAIPSLVSCLNAENAAGGPIRSAHLPANPPYAWALARIGPDSREVLLALLGERGFGRSSVALWSENSKSGLALIRDTVADPTVPVSLRTAAINFLSSRHDTNLLLSVPKLLSEPALRASLLSLVERQGTNAANCLPLLVEAAAQYGREDPKFSERAFQVVERCGKSTPASLIRLLLPLTFDERYPINYALPVDEPVPQAYFVRFALEGITGREKLTGVLSEYLPDPDWRVRNAAAARLWGSATPLSTNAIASLQACLGDTNEIVRLSAVVTLARYPEYRRPVVAELLAAIGSPIMPAPLRVHALYQLEQRHLTASECGPAIPVLQALQHNPNVKIQQVASRVLATLSSPPQK